VVSADVEAFRQADGSAAARAPRCCAHCAKGCDRFEDASPGHLLPAEPLAQLPADQGLEVTSSSPGMREPGEMS